jgi:MFS family permease
VTPKTPSSPVIRAYLLLSAVFTLSASVIWSVNTLFLLDAGLDIFQVFVANAAFTAAMVCFEIPTGVVADTSGRRRSFLLSIATLLAGTLGYVAIGALGGGLPLFVLASIVLGLGFSFYSGSVEAWLVDALAATGYPGQLDGVFALGSMVSGAAMVIGSIGGGVLGSVDLAWPFLVRSGLLVATFVVGWMTMHDLGFTPRTARLAELPTEMRRVLHASIEFGWKRRSVRLIMLVSAVQAAFTMWGFYAWPPFLLALLGNEAVWVAGIVTALMSLATIAGNGLVEVTTRFCGRRTTLLLAGAAVLALAAVGVGLAGSFWVALAFLLVSNIATGVATPVQQAYLHAVVASSQRATVVSSVSLMSSAGSIGGQLGLGYVARARSVAAGYVAGGLVAALAIVPLTVLRRLDERADLIVGRRAGTKGPCAGQGLPAVSTLDTTPRQPQPEPTLAGPSR